LAHVKLISFTTNDTRKGNEVSSSRNKPQPVVVGGVK
jgi:hypothetical protein